MDFLASTIIVFCQDRLLKMIRTMRVLLLIMKVKTIFSMILPASYTLVGLLYESTISLYKRNKFLQRKGQGCIYDKQQPSRDDRK